MPQTLDTDTAQRTRELFTSAIEPGEELKVRFGQKVVYNDSDVGKPQNRITPELFKQIEDLIAGDKGDRSIHYQTSPAACQLGIAQCPA